MKSVVETLKRFFRPSRWMKSLDEITSYGTDRYLQESMPEKIYEAHKHCTNNRSEIEASTVCGCFYCLYTFTPAEIDEWIDNDLEEFPTCPSCGIDSVIGDASGYPIGKDFLSEMNKYWFADVATMGEVLKKPH
jgi:hypothetical protein